MGLVHFKSVHVAGRGNKANTRAQDTIKNIMTKCRRSGYRYIAARAALLKLCPKGGTWSGRLRPLNINTDLRNASGIDPDDDVLDQTPAARRQRALGEGHKDVPWIWRALVPSRKEYVDEEEATAEEVIEGTCLLLCSTAYQDLMEGIIGMRSPYCKATARHRRWKEESLLLCEEMRRVAEYFVWKKDDWLGLRGLRPEAHDGVQDGCNAYASRQAKMWEGMARRCVRKWLGPLEVMGLQVAWSAKVRSAAGLLPQSAFSAHPAPPFVAPGPSSTSSVVSTNPPTEPGALALPHPSLSNTAERTFLEQLLEEEAGEEDQETWEDQEVGDGGPIAESDGADDD